MHCEHTPWLVCSPHASEAGYVRRKSEQLKKAAGILKGKQSAVQYTSSQTYPPPLVLPGDELSYEPKYPSQSLRSWIGERDRNPVDPKPGGRNILYVVGPPEVDQESLAHIQDLWRLKLPRNGQTKELSHPTTQDVIDYLTAFYDGMPVKLLANEGKGSLLFTTWETEDQPAKRPKRKGSKKSIPPAIGLQTSSEITEIRIRKRKDIYPVQLNLNDLLDVAIEILPDDAYALLMLVEQDLYEDDEDDFACGRAYGGSRVAVVSAARYNPAADRNQNVELEHAWPASHCKAYVGELVHNDNQEEPKKAVENFNVEDLSNESQTTIDLSPMINAIKAYPKRSDKISQKAYESLWLGRVCRTASHELGHCFGIDHCVYYACSMQGTASVIEDVRQPPYICPVDLAKLQNATGAGEVKRYRALYEVCSKFRLPSTDLFFGPFAVWLKYRLDELEQRAEA
jgi:archaemetzincin